MREKGRAVFLAALMVLSVVAMSAAFAGGAAAVEDAGTGIDADPSTAGEESTHDATVTVEEGDESVDNELDQIVIDYSNDSDIADADNVVDAIGDASGIDVEIDGVTQALDDTATEGASSTLTIAFDGTSDTVSAGDDISVSVAGVTNPDVGHYEHVAVNLDANSAGTDSTDLALGTTPVNIDVSPGNAEIPDDDTTDVTFTASLTDSNGDAVENVDVVLSSEPTEFSQTVDAGANGEAEFTLSSDAAGNYELTFTDDRTGNSATASLYVSDGDVHYQDSNDNVRSLFYQGQTVTATGLNANADYQLRSIDETSSGNIDSSSFVTELSSDENGEIAISTANLENDDYFVRGPGVEETTANSFELTTQSLDAEFADEQVNAGSTTEIEFDSNRATYNLNVTADSLDADELADIFGVADANVYNDDGVVTVVDAEGAHTVDFTGIDAGEYDFTFEVVDSTAEASDSIEVTDPDTDRNFADSQVLGERGDIVAIGVEMSDANSGAIQLGDEDEVNFESVVEFSADVDEFVLLFNTDNQNNQDGWAVHEDYEDDVDIDDTTEVQGLTNPLGAGDYEMLIGSGYDAGELESESDSAFLTLEEKGAPEEVSTYTAPEDDDLSSLEDFEEATVTESGLIAEGDSLIVAVDDFGAAGSFVGENDGEELNTYLNNQGISLVLEEQNPGTNAEAEVWNTSTATGDNPLLVNAINVEEYDGDLLLEVVYNHEAYAENLSADEAYDVTFAISEGNDYVANEDAEVELENEFEIEERMIEWDDSAEEMENTAESIALGHSNAAPGTEISTRARSSGNFVSTVTTTVEADGDDRVFEASYDFSEYSAGIEFSLTATDPLHQDDRIGGDDVQDQIDSILIEGEDAEEENGEEENGEEENGDEANGDEENGDEANGDEENGDENGDEANGDENGDEANGDEKGEEEDDSSDDGTPGFGVAVAVVALLAAAMLALRRQN